MEEKQKSIGALWLKESKNGNKFMAGNIEIGGVRHDIVMFKNVNKSKTNQPDYHILPSRKKEDVQSKTLPVNNYADVPEDALPF